MAEQQDPPWLDAKVPEVLAKHFEAIYDYMKAQRVVSGINIQFTDADGGGKMPNLISDAGTAGIQIHAFTLIDASTASEGKVRVTYGDVNSHIPTGMSPGDKPKYILSGLTGDGVIYLVATVNMTSYVVTGVTIGHATTVPADSAGIYHKLIGSFSWDANKMTVATSIGGSQNFELCGGVEPIWGL